MFKIKLLAVLAVAVAGMAMSAAPAGAWFRSNNQNKTQGRVLFQSTTFTTGGATVTCESAQGEWHIQTKGQWWEHEVKKPTIDESKQVKINYGPHLYIKIHQWNNCKAEVLATKVPATVSQCVFQLEQIEKGAATSTATVVSTCIIKALVGKAECVITVTPGDHAGVNELLKEIKGANSGQNILSTAAVEGIHAEGESGGKECKVANTSNAKFKSGVGGLIAEGIELA